VAKFFFSFRKPEGKGHFVDLSDDGMLLKWVSNGLYHVGSVEGIVNLRPA
jgi:hypothetical protein